VIPFLLFQPFPLALTPLLFFSTLRLPFVSRLACPFTLSFCHLLMPATFLSFSWTGTASLLVNHINSSSVLSKYLGTCLAEPASSTFSLRSLARFSDLSLVFAHPPAIIWQCRAWIFLVY
jgi:hypothetical protein